MPEVSNIVLIEKGTERYIQKKLLSDINFDMCISKKRFIDYLIENNVSAAKIIGYEERNGNIYEIQEYIESYHNSTNLDECIKVIAYFHKVSKGYEGILEQKKILKDNISIEGTKLNQVLLGFNEKYYFYAHQVFKNIQMDDKGKKSILNMHDCLYAECCKIFAIDECVIHNDLTPNNIICIPKPVLIDFDLAIKSSVYVDVADMLFSRNIEIKDYLEIMRSKDISKKVKIYNDINNETVLEVRGVKLMAALKLFVFIMYIYSQNNMISLDLVEYMKRVYEEAMK